MESSFLTYLEQNLPGSTGADRASWAKFIVEEDIDIQGLFPLLNLDGKIALRFQWLLSDIGLCLPERLLNVLPDLLEFGKTIRDFDFQFSFATYWSIAGIPEENEAEAVELLISLLQSSKTNVTIKSRALKAILPLTEKYPDLKSELIPVLESQLHQYSGELDRRIMKALKTLKTA